MAGMTVPGSTTGKTYRPDAGSYMSDSEYQAWRYKQAGAGTIPGAYPKTPAGGLYPGSPETTLYPNTPSPTAPSGYPTGPLGGLRTAGPGYPPAASPTSEFDALLEAQREQQRQLDLINATAKASATASGTNTQQANTANLEQMREGARLQAEAEARRWAMIGGGGGAAQVAPVAPIDTSAARAAQFAREKDRSGQMARGALNSLYDLMAATGRAGSSIEAGGAAGVLGGAAGRLGDLSREQYIQDLGIGEKQASEQYQGRITQRGQDIDRMNSLLGLVTARGLY